MMEQMDARISVATNIVRSNKEHGKNDAAIRVTRGSGTTLAKQVDILDAHNSVVARVIQTEDPYDSPCIYVEAGPITIQL